MRALSRELAEVRRIACHANALPRLARFSAELAALALFTTALGTGALALVDRAPTPVLVSEAR